MTTADDERPGSADSRRGCDSGVFDPRRDRSIAPGIPNATATLQVRVWPPGVITRARYVGHAWPRGRHRRRQIGDLSARGRRTVPTASPESSGCRPPRPGRHLDIFPAEVGRDPALRRERRATLHSRASRGSVRALHAAPAVRKAGSPSTPGPTPLPWTVRRSPGIAGLPVGPEALVPPRGPAPDDGRPAMLFGTASRVSSWKSRGARIRCPECSLRLLKAGSVQTPEQLAEQSVVRDGARPYPGGNGLIRLARRPPAAAGPRSRCSPQAAMQDIGCR